MSFKSVTRALEIHVFPQMQIIIVGKGAVGPQLTGHRPGPGTIKWHVALKPPCWASKLDGL